LYRKNRTNRSNPNRIGLVWFGSDFIFKVNRTKPNRMLFYLAVQMTFTFKTEPNRTAKTPNGDLAYLQLSGRMSRIRDYIYAVMRSVLVLKETEE